MAADTAEGTSRLQWGRTVAVVVGALLAALTALTIYLGVRVLNETGPWEPLHGYSTQTLVSMGPVDVVVEGTKCNRDDDPVQVFGSFAWVRITAGGPGDGVGGFVVPMSEGTYSYTAPPGCVTRTYRNPIPGPATAGRYQLVGEETPVRNGDTGVTVTYQSEVFDLWSSADG